MTDPIAPLTSGDAPRALTLDDESVAHLRAELADDQHAGLSDADRAAIEAISNSPPVKSAPHNSGERVPSSDAGPTGGEPAPRANKAYEAALENLREAWAALAMIRETVETLVPSGAVMAAEYLDGPTFTHEADALVEGIIAIASAPRLSLDQIALIVQRLCECTLAIEDDEIVNVGPLSYAVAREVLAFPAPRATDMEIENYRLALAWISRQSHDPMSRKLALEALEAFESS